MSFKTILFAATAAVTLAGSVTAEDMAKIMVMDPYARASMKSSSTGAAFMTLKNETDADDRLVAASSDIAKRVELHTHIEDANGVMQMREVEAGFPVPAGGTHALERGGDHVMFMGLNEALVDGGKISVTLTFEKAGDITVEIPVDLTRKPMHGKKKKMGSDG